MNNVKIIKLVSTQELICKVMQETDTELHIASPLIIQPMRSGESSLSIGLMPFTWAGDVRDSKWIAISKAHVLCVLDAEEGLQTQYLAGLSGLSLPQQSSPRLSLVE